MVTNILLKDLDLIETRPISRFNSIFSYRNGIFTTKQRLKQQFPDANISFIHPNKEYEEAICKVEGFNCLKDENLDESNFDYVFTSDNISPFRLLNNVANQLEQDLSLLNAADFARDKLSIVGNKKDLFVHKESNILSGVIFDTRDGIIIIDEKTEITPFSYISGPAYIGKGCRIDNVKLSGGCIIGNQVRIGGEIENSYINDFSNKHHEGFLGHSILGSWVNLGALATTSDLKNNYGQVRLKMPNSFLPSKNYLEELSDIPTGTIKFGSIIGDCVKVAIGTMINTGSVIDCGCNIFGKSPEKYMPPFSWGDKNNRYQLHRFLADCEKIFARRKEKPNSSLKELVETIYRELEK